jgi:hypothetical protein
MRKTLSGVVAFVLAVLAIAAPAAAQSWACVSSIYSISCTQGFNETEGCWWCIDSWNYTGGCYGDPSDQWIASPPPPPSQCGSD